MQSYNLTVDELNGFKQQSEDEFIIETLHFLNKYFKPQIDHLDEKMQHKLIKSKFSEAERYNINLKPEYWKWFIIEMNLGDNFINNPLYKKTIDQFMTTKNSQITLDVYGLVDKILEWIDVGILPFRTGISPHLLAIKYVKTSNPSSFFERLKELDKNKYDAIGYQQVIKFFKEEEVNYNKYSINGADKYYWYFILAWNLGGDFLNSPYYTELKKVFIDSNEERKAVGYFMSENLSKHQWKNGLYKEK